MSQATEGHGSYSHPDVGQRVATAPTASFDGQGKSREKQHGAVSVNPAATCEAHSMILKQDEQTEAQRG